MAEEVQFSYVRQQWSLDGWNPITLGNDFLLEAFLDQLGIWRRGAPE